ncbi:hypothetical protein WR25_07690 isoform F [Diploscapter pachys]|uniref:histone acetyltransferase n=1 Tax=Diploscapter pachys TaxID=2018661 RepID=A0A2A2JPD6_9BILA|nr:hypothetical protein WR25_07690 isoform F [Diploscapter pachys]
MDEPAVKKARLDSEFDSGDGLDGLSELEKMEPLPQAGSDAESTAPGTSKSQPMTNGSTAPPTQSVTSTQPLGMGGPQNQPPTSGNFGPSAVPPTSSSAGSGGSSVLQELLMNQGPATSTINSSPRPPPQQFGAPGSQQPPQPAFNTRSPMTSHSGPASMMSPPNSMAGPNQQVMGTQAGPMRPPGPGNMYPGVPDQGMGPQMTGPQGGPPQQYGAGPPMMGARPPPMGYPNQGYPPQQPGYPPPQGRGQPMQPGRGAMMNGAPPQMARGAMAGPPQRVMPPQMINGPGGGMMRHPMEQPSYPGAPFPGPHQPRPDQYSNYPMGRGQGNYVMMPQHGGPMMMPMDPNQNGPGMGRGPMQPQGGPGGQMMPNMTNGGGPNMPPNQMVPGQNAPPQMGQPPSMPPTGRGQQQQQPLVGGPNSGMMSGPGQPVQAPQQQQQPPMGQPQGGPPQGQAPGQMPPASSQQGPSSNQGLGGPPPGAQDPEKRKLIQQQLVLLLHAHKCQQREREQGGGADGPNGRCVCSLPHCSTMKDVLQHMTTCNNGRQCPYAHCASSRQIIAHWKNCNREDCPVCKPLKNIQNPPHGGPGQKGLGSTPGDLFTDMNTLLGPGSVGPGSVGPRSVDLGIPAFSSPPNAGGMGQGPPSQQHINLLEGYNPGAHQNPMSDFRQPNPPMRGQGGMIHPGAGNMGQPNLPPSMQRQPTDMHTLSFPAPEMPNVVKDWHQHVTKDLRNHLVGKLVKAIFPSPDPNAIYDQRIKDLITYARKVEKEMFESANDREEYYHLLAEKIYKIQKELQEKKNSRLVRPDGSGPGAGQPGTSQQHSGGSSLGSDLDNIMDVHMGIQSASSANQQPGQQNRPNMSAQGQHMQGQSNWGNNNMGEMHMQGQHNQGGFNQMGGQQANQNQPKFGTPSTQGQNNQSMTPQIKNEPSFDESHSRAPSNASAMSNGPTSSSSLPNGMPPRQASDAGEKRLNVKDEPMSDLTRSSTPSSSNGNNTQTASQASSAAASQSTSSLKQELTAPKKEAAAASAPKQPEVKREPTPPPGEDNVWSPDELRQFLRPVWDKLEQSEDAIPFRLPVDPHVLNIPDYFDIIKHPMDLQTIAQRLDQGQYRNPWAFCDDIWLMFDNAWLYNRKNSKVYKYCTKLSELFVVLMDPVMKEMGYCCSRKLSFTPLALFCYGANLCTIARDQPYYVYESSSTQYGVTVSERYTYCLKCFEGLPKEGISLSDNPGDTSNWAPKEKFQLTKNNIIDPEWFETCKYCHRKWHRICGLYDKKVFPEGFICDTCRREKNYPKGDNRFSAKKLPHNTLSKFLEDRVNGFIRNQLKAAADQYQVVIRTLCVQDKEVEVKPLMKAKYGPEGFPEKFPYRTKAVFAFEMIDGAEVCFFGLHVQEYGSNCKGPNARRVYIAYLDSVHFFQPRELRTDVYHEILLGYLDYVKRLGYTMAHIWACPPSEGDDYIFHCHPPEQKIPKPKRLQDWYKKMLEKGVLEKTVIEFKDIYKQARDDNLTTPMMLPYFEGDFWPNIIEDCIREANTEEAQRVKVEADEGDGEEDETGQGTEGGKKKSSKSKKNNLKKSNKMNKKKQGSLTGNEVADKLYSQFEKHKEVFFTIRLVTQQNQLSIQNQPIEDPDPLMPSEMMDGRDTFLTRARDEHWEFSSLRRAKYSTLCLCHALHESDSNKVDYTCNKCSGQAKWHCGTCDDFDLCDACYKLVQHEHKMEPIKSIIGDSGAESSTSNRFESIQRCIQSLVHACQCRDANCRRMSCHKMKRVVQHTKMCKKRVNASCPVCKQLIALCCYHAKHCSRDPCSVPFCMNIRQKLAEQKRSLARRADMMMRRRMEGLHSGFSVAAAGAAAAATSTSQSGASTPSVSTPPAYPNASAHPPSLQGHVKGGFSQPSHSSSMGHNQMGGPSTSMPNNQMGGHDMGQGQRYNMSSKPMMGSGRPGMGPGPMTGHQSGGQLQGQHGAGPAQQQQQQPPTMFGIRQGGPQQNQMGPMGMMQGQSGIGPNMGAGQRGQAPPPYGAGPGNNPNQRGGYSQMGGPNPNGPGGSQSQPMSGSMAPPMQRNPSFGQYTPDSHMPGPGSMGGMGGPQQQQQQQGMISTNDPALNSAIQKISQKLKTSKSSEERQTVFNDLKKSPALFSAFLKMKGVEAQQYTGGLGGADGGPMVMPQQGGGNPHMGGQGNPQQMGYYGNGPHPMQQGQQQMRGGPPQQQGQYMTQQQQQQQQQWARQQQMAAQVINIQ